MKLCLSTLRLIVVTMPVSLAEVVTPSERFLRDGELDYSVKDPEEWIFRSRRGCAGSVTAEPPQVVQIHPPPVLKSFPMRFPPDRIHP